MAVEVYADLLFLVNAGMDGLCLLLTARLLHRRVRAGRLILGAALGGVYAVIALFFEAGQAVSLGTDIGVCLVMCAVVFAGRGGRLLPAAGVYVLMSMVMGGVMTALFHLLNRMGASAWLPEGEDGVAAWIFLLAALVGGAISLWGGRLFRRAAATRTCMVTVELDGRTATLSGLSDSGNLLRDPVGGRSVICVAAEPLEGILSPALYRVLREKGADVTTLAHTEDMRRLRFIPAETATGTGMLLGLRPDRLTITYEGRRGEVAHEVDAVIAVSASMADGVEALVPGELMTNP